MFLSHQQYKESTKKNKKRIKSIKSCGTCPEIRSHPKRVTNIGTTAQTEKSLTNNGGKGGGLVVRVDTRKDIGKGKSKK